MKHTVKIILVLLLVNFSYSILAQQVDKSLLTLDRIFNSAEFSQERFGPARFIEDGKYYTTLETSKDTPGGRDIIKYETETGKREVLVSAKYLIYEGQTKPLSIGNYIWSEQRNYLLIFTNTSRVWRYNTRGDYYLLNLKSNKLQKLGAFAKPSKLMFAKISPDEQKAAYVYENNIYLENLADGKVAQLTFDGSRTTINGTFDWVYEEELDLRDGFRWSPDSKNIAYWQLDASGVGEFFMINNTDSIYSKIIPVQYPKVGTTNSSSKVGVVTIADAKTIWINVPGDSRSNYIARMDWAANSEEVVLQHLNRKQNRNEVMLGNAKTGDVKTIFVETDLAWIDIHDELLWLKNGKEFTWISERDGWKHLYIISRDGKNVRLITTGEYDVIDLLLVDEKRGYAFFIASPDNATQKYLYRINLEGNGKLERLTPKEFSGTNAYQISAGGNYAIHNYSSANSIPISRLIKLPEHKVIKNVVENKTLSENIAVIKKSPTEFFQVDIGGGVLLDAWIKKPYNFDSSKKYPVLFHVYTEPAGQTVVDRWSGDFLWNTMLAQQGYIVISVDNRGTPSPRGRDFRKSIYQKIGILNSDDQALAVKALLQKYSFLDADRVGVWGWSGGGSATLNAMFRYPDIYKMGMSVAPVGHQKLYDTIYQERYMGLINENPEIYDEGSPVTFAKNLKGNLLIVHGTGDDNVHYQGTELVINELIKHNKHFTMMAYPNRAHGIYEGEGTTMHLYSLLTRYLNENLPACAK